MRIAACTAALLTGDGMDERQEDEISDHNSVHVYQVPEKKDQSEGKPALQPNIKKTRSRRWLWLFVLVLAAWLACIGLTAYALLPLIIKPQPVVIPVTGVDPTRPPAHPTEAQSQPKATAPSNTTTPSTTTTPPTTTHFLEEANLRLEACSQSFHDYYILENLALDNPGLFQNEAWRTDVTNAMNVFHDACQSLGTLPAAPRAYKEVEHWLKLAAGEVEPATKSFTAALKDEQIGQFQISMEHMLRFVDYIHNAQGAMDGMKQRKEI